MVQTSATHLKRIRFFPAEFSVYLRHCDDFYDVDNVPWHTGILGTLPLTETPVSANSSGCGEGSGTSTRVHCDGFADDEAISNKLADGLAGVGV